MSLISRIKQGASAVKSRVEDAATDAKKSVEQVADKAAEKISQATFSPSEAAAQKQATQVVQPERKGASAEEIASSVPAKKKQALASDVEAGKLRANTSGVFGGIGGRTLEQLSGRVGAQVRKAGADLVDSARSLTPSTLADTVKSAGEQAQTLGSELLKKPADLLDSGRRAANGLYESGKKVLEQLDDVPIGKPLSVPPELRQKIADGASSLLERGKELLEGVSTTSREKRDQVIDDLKPGDSATISVGAEGSYEIGKGAGPKAGEKVQYQLERTPEGKYKLSFEGEVAVGVTAGKKGVGSAEVGVGGGAKVEYLLDSADDTKRAIDVLSKQQAAASVAGGMRYDFEKKRVVTGGEFLEPSDADKAWLASKTSAVEVKGGVFAAGDLSGPKLGGSGVDLAALTGKAGVKGDVAVRIEYANGKPSHVVLKQQGELEVGATTSAQAGDVVKAQTGQATVKATVTKETKIPIPANVDTERLLKGLTSDPPTLAPADSRALKAMSDNTEQSVTIAFDGKAEALGNGGGVRTELKVSGTAAELRRAQGALKDYVQSGGRDLGALRRAGDNIKASGKAETYTSEGTHLKGGVSVGPVSLGAEGLAQVKKVQSSETFGRTRAPDGSQRDMTLSELVDAHGDDFTRALENVDARG